ncbi:MAG: cobalt-precorrin-6A reductase [Proteobacteria bacterium]|nr:cobalt-precorrin-6A reductase [Pseudomonadota bacterium]
MTEVPRILLLGGTEEAVRLNHLLSERAELSVVTSLAGRTSAPTALNGEVITGGFGGQEGLETFLTEKSVDYIIDATHPFASQITNSAFMACQKLGINYLRLDRPPWPEKQDDIWIKARNVEEAADKHETYSRIFLSIGRQELTAFQQLSNKQFLVRSIEAVAFNPPASTVRFIQARGPFSLAAELELFKEYQIEVLVSKNSGGDATYAKIAAARELGLPVIMIERPEGPNCTTFQDVDGLFQAFLLGRNTCT